MKDKHIKFSFIHATSTPYYSCSRTPIRHILILGLFFSVKIFWIVFTTMVIKWHCEGHKGFFLILIKALTPPPYVYLSLWVSLCICIRVFLYLCIFIFVYFYICVFMCLCFLSDPAKGFDSTLMSICQCGIHWRASLVRRMASITSLGIVSFFRWSFVTCIADLSMYCLFVLLAVCIANSML